MKFSLIKEDSTVYVDGEARLVSMEGLAKDVRAVQFKDGHGHVEYENCVYPNSALNEDTFESDYMIFVDRWVKAAPLIEEHLGE